MKFKKIPKLCRLLPNVEKRFIYGCEPGATELELFKPLKESILLHWELQNFNQEIFAGAEQCQGFVDYFKY